MCRLQCDRIEQRCNERSGGRTGRRVVPRRSRCREETPLGPRLRVAPRRDARAGQAILMHAPVSESGRLRDSKRCSAGGRVRRRGRARSRAAYAGAKRSQRAPRCIRVPPLDFETAAGQRRQLGSPGKAETRPARPPENASTHSNGAVACALGGRGRPETRTRARRHVARARERGGGSSAEAPKVPASRFRAQGCVASCAAAIFLRP